MSSPAAAIGEVDVCPACGSSSVVPKPPEGITSSPPTPSAKSPGAAGKQVWSGKAIAGFVSSILFFPVRIPVEVPEVLRIPILAHTAILWATLGLSFFAIIEIACKGRSKIVARGGAKA